MHDYAEEEELIIQSWQLVNSSSEPTSGSIITPLLLF